MGKEIRIAIYSGEVPSTVFIERLIRGLGLKDYQIYLFGQKNAAVSYPKNIYDKSYAKSRRSKFWVLIKYTVLLLLFKRKEKKHLDRIIKNQSSSVLHTKVKFYPVLWCQPDIFHLQWAKGLAEWIWVKEFGIKLILSLRGAHINYSPIADEALAQTYRDLFPNIDRFHAVSKAIATEAEKYNANPEKIDVVYSGLDLNEFKNVEVANSDVFQMISIGRPHWVKGYHYALDACRLLLDNNFSFKYTIVGGADDIELLYQIKDLGLGAHVELLPKQPFKDVKLLIGQNDLLLLPSVKEGLANVVLEAMALKTTALSTDSGGMNEVIEDGVNGFLVSYRNPEQMANRIIEISNLNAIDIQVMHQKAMDTIINQHTDRLMIEGMANLYNRVQK